jgi:hypothetical protein
MTARSERGDQCVGVDVSAASDVHEQRMLRHRGERRRVDDVLRLGRQREGDDHRVRVRDRVVQVGERPVRSAPGERLGAAVAGPSRGSGTVRASAAARG